MSVEEVLRQRVGCRFFVAAILETNPMDYPLYLITLFGKNEQSNLSKAERNELGDLVEILLGIWTEK